MQPKNKTEEQQRKPQDQKGDHQEKAHKLNQKQPQKHKVEELKQETL